jgi:hypothetical protein
VTPSPTVHVFFYGSYMNRRVLAEAQVAPERFDVARLDGYEIRIGPRANLYAAPGTCVYGLLAPATHDELSRLYAHAQERLGEIYVPHPVLVQTHEGGWFAALCYLSHTMVERPPDAAYVDRIIEPAREHAFPGWYIDCLAAYRPADGDA